jgi:hypothetical protein
VGSNHTIIIVNILKSYKNNKLMIIHYNYSDHPMTQKPQPTSDLRDDYEQII